MITNNTCQLNDLFHISYGTKLDLNKMDIAHKHTSNTVNFVSRLSKNGGVSAIVHINKNIQPIQSGAITVTLGGTYLLASFLQLKRFYSSQNVAILTPKKEMSIEEKIYYCICIRSNRYRYSAFGREANRTLHTIQVPTSAPEWVKSQSISKSIKKPKKNSACQKLDIEKWSRYRLDTIFDLKKGKRITKANIVKGSTPFISAIDSNNGIREYIKNKAMHEGNTITVNYNGSVGEAFYQEREFWASDDVNVLYPKFKLNQYIAMFIITVLKKEQYRYNYGRKWHLERMSETIISLPSKKNGDLDLSFMKKYIENISYGSEI